MTVNAISGVLMQTTERGLPLTPPLACGEAHREVILRDSAKQNCSHETPGVISVAAGLATLCQC